MTAEQLVVLVLLIAAFAAGWVARDPPRPSGRPEEPADDEPLVEDDPAPVEDARPDEEPAQLVGATADALAAAVDAWLDGAHPSGPLGTLDAAIDDLREASARDRSGRLRDALDAADAARGVLSGFAEGRPLDAAASRALEPLEERLESARLDD